MATPIKSVLRVLTPKASPITPKLLNVPRAVTPTTDNKVKILSPENRFLQPRSLSKPQNLEQYSNGQFEIPILNTPLKQYLLQNGIRNSGFKGYIIGRGRFGIVIKAKHRGVTVAVKIVKKNNRLGEHNALHLKHENIIENLELFEKKGSTSTSNVLIIMQYYENSVQLQLLLEDEQYFLIDKTRAIQISLDIVEGLRYCHAHGILHLDIKPANVIWCDGICKLCDFGNSSSKDDLEALKWRFNGTIYYAAPELLLGQLPTHKSDVYSLGIVMWQIVHRQQPYGSTNPQIVIYKVVKFNLRPQELCSIQSTAFDDISPLYRDCWASCPKDRPDLEKIAKTLLNILT